MAKFFDRLTQSCQSGASAAALAALLVAAAPAGAQPAWAHQAAGFQSNGAISVKSLAGGAYGGTQNPLGAVARANQSAVTQPPTVIIQATASQLQQAYPQIKSGTLAIPACAAGYNVLWSASATGISGASIPELSNNGTFISNIAGTKWSFGQFNQGGQFYVGFFLDAAPFIQNEVASTFKLPYVNAINGTPSQWAASLCGK